MITWSTKMFTVVSLEAKGLEMNIIQLMFEG